MSHKPPWSATTTKSSPLDNLMMSCTDLRGGKKGSGGSSSFKGPALKDVKIEKSLGPSYKPSQKSRDWSTLSQNLEDAFVVSSLSSPRAATSQNVMFQQPTPVLSPQPIAQQVRKEAKDDWGDFQNFNHETNSIKNSSQNIFPHKVEDAVGGYGLAFTASNSETFAASLAPQTQPTSNLDDDDFAEFVTATPNTNASSLKPITPFSNESFIPCLPSVPPFRASSLSPPTSNILKSAEISSSNTILSSNTIGSRLATFQEESPIHRFKANIPAAIDNPSLLEGPNIDQVIAEDNEDDFGDFASARHVITSSNTNTFPVSLDTTLPVAKTNTNNPFLTSSDVRGDITENSFPASFTASPALQPISSTHDDRYSAFRDAFSDDPSTTKRDTNLDESKFPTGIEHETNKPKDRTSDSFGGVTIPVPSSSNSIIPDLTASSLEPKSVSSLCQKYSIPKSTNPSKTQILSVTNEEDDFGDFIAVRNEKPTPALASNEITKLASISSVKEKSTENKHVRSDAFFMPQQVEVGTNNSSTIMPIWHDSEPPPLIDEHQISTGSDKKPVGTGVIKDDFFEGFDDNDVTTSEEPVGAFGCSSILDEDQYFEAPQAKNNSIPPEIDTKLSQEQIPAGLNMPPIPRENSISSLNLRVGSSSPEDVEDNQRSEDEACHNEQTNAKQYGHYEKKSDVKDDLSLDKSFKSPLKEWFCMLTQIHLLVSQATDSFTYIRSNAVLEEVLESKEGSNYIKNIVELYRVYKRIQISYQKYAENKSYKPTAIIKTNEDEENKEMVQKSEKIEQAWTQLIINLNGKSIIPEKAVFSFAQCLLKETDHKRQMKDKGDVDDSCGLCLLSVSISNYLPKYDKDRTEMVDTVLEHGNRMYHSTCANFWVNRIDLVLPRLTLTL